MVAAAAVVVAGAVVGHVAEAPERRLCLERPALSSRAGEPSQSREFGQGPWPSGDRRDDGVSATAGSVVQIRLQLAPQGPRYQLWQSVQMNLKHEDRRAIIQALLGKYRIMLGHLSIHTHKGHLSIHTNKVDSHAAFGLRSVERIESTQRDWDQHREADELYL